MKKFVKIIISLTVFSLAVSLMKTWFDTFVLGQYYLHGSIFASTFVGIIIPVLIVVGCYVLLKKIIKF